MKVSGIYSIQSKCKPDRVYIGSATNMKDRWSDHLWKLSKQIHENPKIQRHYNKYGKDDLVFKMIEPCLPQFLTIQEQGYIKRLKPYFNICKIAGSHLGCKRSEESKLRMSIAQKKRKIKHSPEAIEKNRIAHLGKTPWNKGKKATLQARLNQSIAHMGKGGWNKGLKRSDEVRLQMSIRQMGRIVPVKVREKISKSMMGELNHFYGKKHSDETRKKIGQISSMRRKSEETRRKISESLKGKTKKGKSILQYDKQMNLIREWDSIASAEKELKIWSSNIGVSLRNNDKTAGGFIWKYQNKYING